MTDDQDVASMEAMPIVRRRIADRGVEFANSYVALSECCPSRVTFLTGQHAHNHGVETSKPPEGGYPALDSTNTLPVWLDDAGYRTGQVGRYVNFYGNSRVGGDPREVPPGWDDWHVPVEHTEFQVYDYVLNENGRLVSYGDRPRDYSTDVFARKAVDFIDDAAKRDKPFFLWVTPLASHSEGVLDDVVDPRRDPRPAPRDDGAFEDVPVPRPPSFGEDLSDKPRVIRERAKIGVRAEPSARLEGIFRGRRESLLAVDRMVGRIMNALERTGELERTYVIFTSDHGFLQGEHRQLGKNLVYEESVRTPLVARGPGIEPGSVRRELVQNIDLAPAITEVAGASAERELDGVPLFGRALDPLRDLFLTYPRSKVAFDAVRSHDGYVYVEYERGNRDELYDLNEDPFQLDNLVDEPGLEDVRERLAGRLEELRGCAGDECR